MLVIHPDGCIDCGGCEPECRLTPSSLTPSRASKWLKINAVCPQMADITIKRDAPADAKEFEGIAGKFEAHFSENPGEGD